MIIMTSSKYNYLYGDDNLIRFPKKQLGFATDKWHQVDRLVPEEALTQGTTSVAGLCLIVGAWGTTKKE